MWRGLPLVKRNQADGAKNWDIGETHEMKFFLDCAPSRQERNSHTLGNAVHHRVVVFKLDFDLRCYLEFVERVFQDLASCTVRQKCQQWKVVEFLGLDHFLLTEGMILPDHYYQF